MISTPSFTRDRKSTRLNATHPPRSTLFPYTTLFRSQLALQHVAPRGQVVPARAARGLGVGRDDLHALLHQRSEEHTSERHSPTEIYTLSLHDALPISARAAARSPTRPGSSSARRPRSWGWA